MLNRFMVWLKAYLPPEFRTPGRVQQLLFGHHSGLRVWHKLGLGREHVRAPRDAEPRLKALVDVWPCCSTGYYTVDIGGIRLPGGRVWSERWNTLRSVTDYRNRTTLELGCNMAILSTSLLKYCDVKQAVAVDLNRQALRTARVLAEYYNVSPTLLRMDFDVSRAWEESLAAYHPDIVFVLSVLRWVRNKERLLTFLSRFDQIVYEGHEPVQDEVNRLKRSGFAKVDIVESKPGERAILLATK